MTNSFGYVTLGWNTKTRMFNLAFKKDLKNKRSMVKSRFDSGQGGQMAQVKKILEQKGQGLILMARG